MDQNLFMTSHVVCDLQSCSLGSESQSELFFFYCRLRFCLCVRTYIEVLRTISWFKAQLGPFCVGSFRVMEEGCTEEINQPNEAERLMDKLSTSSFLLFLFDRSLSLSASGLSFRDQNRKESSAVLDISELQSFLKRNAGPSVSGFID